MYYDLIIVGLIIIWIIFFCRKFSNFVYLIAVVDIFLRILTFIKLHIGLPDVSALISKYVPESIPSIITKYTNGVLSLIILWIYVFIMICFLFYTARILWKKR